MMWMGYPTILVQSFFYFDFVVIVQKLSAWIRFVLQSKVVNMDSICVTFKSCQHGFSLCYIHKLSTWIQFVLPFKLSVWFRLWMSFSKRLE